MLSAVQEILGPRVFNELQGRSGMTQSVADFYAEPNRWRLRQDGASECLLFESPRTISALGQRKCRTVLRTSFEESEEMKVRKGRGERGEKKRDFDGMVSWPLSRFVVALAISFVVIADLKIAALFEFLKWKIARHVICRLDESVSKLPQINKKCHPLSSLSFGAPRTTRTIKRFLHFGTIFEFKTPLHYEPRHVKRKECKKQNLAFFLFRGRSAHIQRT